MQTNVEPLPGKKLPAEAWVAKNGVMIARFENNAFGVTVRDELIGRDLLIEIDYLGYWYRHEVHCFTVPYRDCLDVDITDCVIRVKDGDSVLAELGEQPQGHLYQAWMVQQGDQAHVSENYNSVPPCCHLTDAGGHRWTLGFTTAYSGKGPEGEFAFNVLRDGIDMNQIASRIEIRDGTVRVFTRHGWKRWLGYDWS